jgi:peptidoglycan/LPS O-acetylase OafA/YrhL
LSEESIRPVHGIRAILSIWVILVHLIFYAYGATGNIQFFLANVKNLAVQPIYAGTMAVDAFFSLRYHK